MRPIILGIIAAFFFAFTFVLNRSMELEGGSWIWSASLRYAFMVPFLLIIVALRKNLGGLFSEMKRAPWAWTLWSFVGFVLFYGPLSFAAAFGPGWLIAGTWQLVIISGSLLSPLFFISVQTETGEKRIRGRIPIRGLLMSLVILAGVVLMQVEQMNRLDLRTVLFSVIPIIIASFAYPLGNRKMMELTEGRLDPYQRVLGMTLLTLPFWFILGIYGVATVGGPSSGQVLQSLVVGVTSGVIATVLFFKATDLVQGDMAKLGAVEATQSAEVLFAVVGEVIWLQAMFPSTVSTAGILLVIVGMILHSYVANRPVKIRNYTELK